MNKYLLSFLGLSVVSLFVLVSVNVIDLKSLNRESMTALILNGSTSLRTTTTATVPVTTTTKAPTENISTKVAVPTTNTTTTTSTSAKSTTVLPTSTSTKTTTLQIVPRTAVVNNTKLNSVTTNTIAPKATVATSANKSPETDPTGPKGTGCVQPPTGMVSWWTGDTTAEDYFNINDGTLVGNANIGLGKVLNGFRFKEASDYVDIPFNSTLNPTPGNALSIDYWAKRISNDTTLVSHVCKNLKGENFYCVQSKGGQVIFSITGLDPVSGQKLTAVTKTSTTAFPVNTWKHIAVVYNGQDNRTMKIYIDGVLATTSTSTTGIPPSSILTAPSNVPTRIGGDQSAISGAQNGIKNSNGFVGGHIDEVEFFNRAISQTEIQSIFNAGSFGKCKRTTVNPEKGSLQVVLKTFKEDSNGQMLTFQSPAGEGFDFKTDSTSTSNPFYNNGSGFELDTLSTSSVVPDNKTFYGLTQGNYKISINLPATKTQGYKWMPSSVSCVPSTGITTTVLPLSSTASFNANLVNNSNTVCTFKVNLEKK